MTGIRTIIEAAGGPVALSKALGVTYTAVNGWERQGYLPLERAKEVLTMWPGVCELRDLVHPSIRTAMDMQAGNDLLS